MIAIIPIGSPSRKTNKIPTKPVRNMSRSSRLMDLSLLSTFADFENFFESFKGAENLIPIARAKTTAVAIVAPCKMAAHVLLNRSESGS